MRKLSFWQVATVSKLSFRGTDALHVVHGAESASADVVGHPGTARGHCCGRLAWFALCQGFIGMGKDTSLVLVVATPFVMFAASSLQDIGFESVVGSHIKSLYCYGNVDSFSDQALQCSLVLRLGGRTDTHARTQDFGKVIIGPAARARLVKSQCVQYKSSCP